MRTNTLSLRTDSNTLPPLYPNVLRNILAHGPAKNPLVFGGVYDNKNDIPDITRLAFFDPKWIDYIRTSPWTKTKYTVSPDETLNQHRLLLSNLTATEIRSTEQPVTILDFGGGLGEYYRFALHKLGLKEKNRLRFRVVETKDICVAGRKIFAKDDRVAFSDNIDSISNTETINIAFLSSCLHYCLEWQEVLRNIVTKNPKYLLIGRHHSPEFTDEIFYSVQDIYVPKGYSGQMPMVLLSVSTIESYLWRFNYRLSANLPFSDISSSYSGNEDKKYATMFLRTLLFERADTSLI